MWPFSVSDIFLKGNPGRIHSDFPRAAKASRPFISGAHLSMLAGSKF